MWCSVAPMLSKRCRLGVTTLNGHLVVCGGYNGSVFLKTVESYDPIANQWTEVCSNIKFLITRFRIAFRLEICTTFLAQLSCVTTKQHLFRKKM